MNSFVGTIDQGTTSTRCIIFDHAGRAVSRSQLEHRQILPQPGHVEHDPVELWQRTQQVVEMALRNARITAADLAAIGVTSQRETTVVWNRRTGIPYHNAIVWQDTRTDAIVTALRRDGRGDVIRDRSGLPAAPYFSGGKLQWLLENVPGLRRAAEDGEAIFGTIDTWLTWNLTGGTDGGRHVTDVTNASRTMLMDLSTLDWDDELLSFFDIPRAMLPTIVPSGDRDAYGRTRADGPFAGEVTVAAVLGDQQAATVGQACFSPGETKNTYGTGNFVLINTGNQLVRSKHGGLTTVCYQFAGQAPVFALEGSVAITGAAVQWLRDQMGVIDDAAESEALASQVPDSGGAYFVPAFSGLFTPHWRSDARGTIVGLSRFSTKAHLARATLEAICYQSLDVIEALEHDTGVRLECLKVDGGITSNSLCMQIQADVLGVPVVRPSVAETTPLGAAYAAGLAVGYWRDTADLRANWVEGERWEPRWTAAERAQGHANWRRAISRAVGWAEVG